SGLREYHARLLITALSASQRSHLISHLRSQPVISQVNCGSGTPATAVPVSGNWTVRGEGERNEKRRPRVKYECSCSWNWCEARMLEPDTIVQVLLRERLRVTALAAAVIRDVHAADDIFQQVVLAALEARSHFRNTDHVLAWSFRTARCRALD